MGVHFKMKKKIEEWYIEEGKLKKLISKKKRKGKKPNEDFLEELFKI